MESSSSKTVKLILRLFNFKKPYTTYDLDIEKVRKKNIAVPRRWMCRGCKVENENVNSYRIWVLTPEKLKNKKVIIYFHGGGYVEGMVKQHWNTIAKIAVQTGSKVIIPEYPLAPEKSYKDVFSMISETYDFVLNTNDNTDISFIGDSAGGGMLLSFAMFLKEKNRALPGKLVALSPWVDISMTNTEMEELDKLDPMISIPGLKRAGEMYANGTNTKNYQVSPLYGKFEGLPPTYIFAGTHDILYPDAKLYANKSKAAGVETFYYEYPEMIHAWMFIPLSEAKSTIKKIAEIL